MSKRWLGLVLVCGASLSHGADEPSATASVAQPKALPDVRQIPTPGIADEGALPNLTPRLYREEPLAPLLPPPTPDEKLIATTKSDDWLAAGMEELRKAQAERDKQARDRTKQTEAKDNNQRAFLPGLGPNLGDGTGRVSLPKPTPAPNPYLSATAPLLPKRDVTVQSPRPASAAPTALPTPVPTRSMQSDREEEQKYFRQLQRF